MNRYLLIILLLCCFVYPDLSGQFQRFTVKRASFSSGLNDEFSPVFYQGGIVFCSNQRDNSLVGFKDEKSRMFKIYFLSNTIHTLSKQPVLLARELTSGFNDGPATFNETGDLIYFSRNNSIENSLRNISDTLNKLGLYSAELIHGIWTVIKPFRYNNPLYSFYTPALATDGNRLFFASDMPGGRGGVDLYYCNRLNNDWDKPVNLGSDVNTAGNESFPFICKSGRLYFASDGHKGLGGKDLFYTEEVDGKWITPMHLDSAINSTADDFGLVMDSTMENGYFSTNRRKSDDIFSFSSVPVNFTNCENIQENNYCYTFYDEKHQFMDTSAVIYRWNFGDGISHTGTEVKHCFPGPGNYSVKLSITDELSGKSIADQVEYKVELKDIRQAYIESYNVGVSDSSVLFTCLQTGLTGFGEAGYFWDFGEGFKPGGNTINKIFRNKGEYTVRLGLIARNDSLGVIQKTCVTKNVRIYNSYEEFILRDSLAEWEAFSDVNSFPGQTRKLQIMLYFMDDLSEKKKSAIKESVGKTGISTVDFDHNEVLPCSYPLLNHIALLLKENPDIRLEIVSHGVESGKPDYDRKISEKLSRELEFYFRTRESDMNLIHSKGLDVSFPAFGSLRGKRIANESVQFIFMRN